MDFGVETINSWSDFETLQNHVFEMKSSFVFRGQSDSSWGLVPSLHRLVPVEGGIEPIKKAEADLLNQFRRRTHLEYSPSVATQSEEKWGTWMTMMQHHGVPTRLLDWTNSPYVALYFAVHTARSNDPEYSTSGTLWLLNTTHVHNHFDDAVEEWKAGKEQNAFENLMTTAMFEDPAVPNILSNSRSLLSTEREVLQQGSFTYSMNPLGTHDDALKLLSEANSGSDEPTLARIEISADIKSELRAHLRIANISAATLFPGIDGVGTDLTEQYL